MLTAADIAADCQAEAASAATPAAKVSALISMSAAQRNSDDPALTAAADATMQSALGIAQTIAAPEEKCRTLLTLSRNLSNVIMHTEAATALTQAITAARATTPVAASIPLLLLAANESFLQANGPQSVQLLEESLRLLQAVPSPDAATLQTLAVALIRRGEWPRGAALLARIPAGPARTAALDAAGETAAEDSMSIDPAKPPPRGEPVDGIRKESAGDQARAVNLVEQQPPGYARARAWLAMAKALTVVPSSLSDYMATGSEPAGGNDALPSGPDEDTPKEAPPGEWDGKEK